MNKVKALGLSSGGLDSMLAALVLKKQGIYVEYISFKTPFFSSENAEKAALLTDIPIIVKNITEEYLPMLKNPTRGYGKNMNPCLDCHALMFSIAGRIMKEKGFNFIFSGEVSGQRPMSQTKNALRYIEKRSGFAEYILRPLSAKKLPETLMEKNGAVAREKLLDLYGRGRKEQMRLAAEFGINEYPAPAGGCLLTDKNFSRRLKDIFEYKDSYSENELELLKYGRHLRIDKNNKFIIGRDEKENEIILSLKDDKDIALKMENFPGPLVLISGENSGKIVKLAAALAVSYSKADIEKAREVTLYENNSSYIVKSKGILKSEIQKFLI